MIHFEMPVFLLLLIPFLLYQFRRPFPSRSVNILQFLITLLLICALSGMKIRFPEKEGVLFILCDRSFSMPAGAEKAMEKQIKQISRRMKNSPGVISFAGNVFVDKLPGQGTFSGFKSDLSRRHASDISGAVNAALKLIPRDTPGRILLMSDGRWNGKDPEELFAAALMRQIRIDFLPVERTFFNDFAITGISAPLTAAPGEYSSLVCRIRAPRAETVRCRLRKNGGRSVEQLVRLRPGENRVLWRDRNDSPGVSRYEFSISAPGDTVPENDSARHLVEVRGKNKILLLSNSPSGNLEKLLKKGGFELERFSMPSPEVSPETLGSYRAVILENLPASALSPAANATLAELVKAGRMGVFMTGGSSSLAAGGWYKTPVGDLLPAALEQQHEIRRNRSALMVALDRSGSMSAAVDGVSKMAMANLAAAESCKLLSPQDEFGLIAVDSSVHQVVPLGIKGESDHASLIMSIEAMGGGIFVDRALHECVRQLLRSDAPVRHLLLFADAADAEQPGDYKELLRKAVKAGITVSVAGLGRADSSDAELLRDIARLGKGKCYFVENPSELPRVFAEDTFVMVRAAFCKEKVQVRTAPEFSLLPGMEKLTLPFEADGYNLCFAKPRSRVLLFAGNEEKSPLALTGYAGLGRTAVLALEADGAYSGKFASHPQTGKLIAALTRYVIMSHENRFKDCFITQSMESGVFKSEILLDPLRRRMPFSGTPHLSLLVTEPRGKVTVSTVEFRWQGPDKLQAQSLIPPGATVNGAVSFGTKEIVPLAPAVQSISPEFSAADSADIRELVRWTRGDIKSSFDDIGSSMERQSNWFRAAPVLLGGAIVLLLLQVWFRRSGREFPALTFGSIHFAFSRRKTSRGDAAKEKRAKETPAPPAVKKEEPEQNENALSAALKRAKRR